MEPKTIRELLVRYEAAEREVQTARELLQSAEAEYTTARDALRLALEAGMPVEGMTPANGARKWGLAALLENWPIGQALTTAEVKRMMHTRNGRRVVPAIRWGIKQGSIERTAKKLYTRVK
jgi:hypothetical protein